VHRYPQGGMLNIKYSKKKHELQDDPVMDGLLKTKEFISKNSNSVTGVIIAAVVVIGLGVGYNQFRLRKIENAREEFGKAMVAYNEKNTEAAISQFTAVAQNYRGSISGSMASYMLANILYTQGRYDEAIDWYNTVLSGPDIGFMTVEANEGISACYESKNDIGSAVKYLEKAIANEKAAFRYSALRWKLALLTKDSDPAKAVTLCNEIIADSLANDYRQEARYLKTMISK